MYSCVRHAECTNVKLLKKGKVLVNGCMVSSVNVVVNPISYYDECLNCHFFEMYFFMLAD